MTREYPPGPGGRLLTEAPSPQAIAFCGWSGSGKTTLIEALIPRLTARGLRVAVIKHDAHGVQLDTPGKDSDRFFRGGASVVLRGPDEVAWRLRPTSATTLKRSLAALSRSHDVVLVEGHKETPLPKVWLAPADERSPPSSISGIVEVLPWSGRRADRAEKIVLERLATAQAAIPVIGGLLVGGASRRMGRPKQLIEVAGETLAEKAVAALEPHTEEVVLLGAGDVTGRPAGLRRLVDAPGIEGPLAGVLAATRWAPGAAWLVAACDLPRIESGAVRWLLDQRRIGRWAVLPETGSGVEPLLAVYEPQAGELLEVLAAEGCRAPSRLAGRNGVASPAVPPDLAGCWFNANTPGDLAVERAG